MSIVHRTLLNGSVKNRPRLHHPVKQGLRLVKPELQHQFSWLPRLDHPVKQGLRLCKLFDKKYAIAQIRSSCKTRIETFEGHSLPYRVDTPRLNHPVKQGLRLPTFGINVNCIPYP